MSREIRADYEQTEMMPACLEDWVGVDHPARFLREFVDALDLGALGFRERESAEGAPSYAPDLLLKAWLYGYMKGIRSTRRLEEACREHMSLIWLTGRHAPDHNTLWRFFRDNRAALRKVFRAGVRVAAEQGLVGMICHAVDGTKIPAVASGRTTEHREDLERALERIEASIAEMEAGVEKAEEEEAGEYALPASLQEAEKLRAAIRTSLERMKEAEREHLHPGEPEARLMPCGARKEPAYNAQAVVDAKAGIIVAEDTVNAESDNQMLVPMLEETKSNLGAVAAETVADGGYSSAQQLDEAQARGYEVIVAEGAETGGRDRGDYDSANFQYDGERDEVICPRGERLKYEATQNKGSHRLPVRRYRCQSFRNCPVRELCSQSKQGRQIEWSPQHEALRRQRSKRQDPAKRALLRRRKVIVEPVFGQLKQNEGFRRWTVRGLENVRAQWALLCTAYNLKKLSQAWRKRLNIATCSFGARTSAPALALEDALLLPHSTLRLEF
jgi:transposase